MPPPRGYECPLPVATGLTAGRTEMHAVQRCAVGRCWRDASVLSCASTKSRRLTSLLDSECMTRRQALWTPSFLPCMYWNIEGRWPRTGMCSAKVGCMANKQHMAWVTISRATVLRDTERKKIYCMSYTCCTDFDTFVFQLFGVKYICGAMSLFADFTHHSWCYAVVD